MVSRVLAWTTQPWFSPSIAAPAAEDAADALQLHCLRDGLEESGPPAVCGGEHHPMRLVLRAKPSARQRPLIGAIQLAMS
jgi:hypothetical protein